MSFAPRSVPERLRQVAAGSDVVWFVGSGVSAWSGLPDWGQLIASLREFAATRSRNISLIDVEIARGDYLRAASHGFDVLTESERATFIRNAVDLSHSRPSDLHRAILATGAKNFITTNFDSLLEQTINDPACSIVKGSQRVELAEIVRARAANFVFKAHGDAQDLDSIVFTREQYREMLDGRRNVAQALKTLLVSRPVIYVGFGLRDPDFVQAMDALSVDFRTPLQDHFAFVSDVSTDEIDYWRRSTGIELVPYEKVDSANPHSELLTSVLELNQAAALTFPDPTPATDAGVMRLLSRTRSLSRQAQPSETFLVSFSVRDVHAQLGKRGSVPQTLLQGRGDVLIVGPPGSGKSTAVAQTAEAMAAEALEQLLKDPDERSAFFVPVVLPLRNYEDGLEALAESVLTNEAPLSGLVGHFPLCFILDGLNEVPLANGGKASFGDELTKFLERTAESRHILVTRYEEDWKTLDLPVLTIEAASREAVEAILTERGVRVSDVDPPVLEALGRPLFLRMLSAERLPISTIGSIHDLYGGLLRVWGAEIEEALGAPVDLSETLRRVAYETVSAGSQLFSAESILRSIGSHGDGSAILDALIERGVLVAEPGRRVAFFHHSVTEYFAAAELADRIAAEPARLDEALATRNWDHPILLALGFLKPAQAAAAFDRLLHVDPAVAIRGLWYLDSEQVAWTKSALIYLANHPRERPFRDLSIPNPGKVIAELKLLADAGDAVGGEAAALMLAQEEDRDALSTALASELLSHSEDYSYCAQLGEKLATVELDLATVWSAFDAVSGAVRDKIGDDLLTLGSDDRGPLRNIVNCFATLVAAHLIDHDAEIVERLGESDQLGRAVLIEATHESPTYLSVAWLADEAATGDIAVFWLYLTLSYGGKQFAIEPGLVARFEILIDNLFQKIARGDTPVRWEFDLVFELGKTNPRVAALVDEVLATASLISRVSILAMAGRREEALDAVGDALEAEESEQLAIDFADSGFDWSIRPDLFKKVLRANNHGFAVMVLDSMRPLFGRADWRLTLDASDIEAAIEFVSRGDSWGRVVAPAVVGGRADEASKREILAQFESADTTRRRELLPFLDCVDVARHDLSEGAIDWLLGHAGEVSPDPWGSGCLARIADDEFVRTRLIECWKHARGARRRSYARWIEACGRHLRHRYISDDLQTLVRDDQ